VNQYETQLVKEALEKHGFREADEGENADLCVVNTCTVTHNGDSKSRHAVRQLARENPSARTVVMGCYATNDPETVASLPNVVEVVTDKRELPDLFDRLGLVEQPTGISQFDGRHRAFVKVQDGCILKCTYCIIPQVRPGLRSRPVDEIEDEVRRLIDNGYREIVLCGIHVGHFGVDTTRGKSGLSPFRLWHLFRRLDRIPGNWRMRLSSIETAEVNDDFIKAAADCEHLCPQFHPALQSGSETVLRRMRRRYSVARFLEKLDRMREVLPNPGFTTDVIVGFPGVTEAEFVETLEACRQAEFLKIHIFPFRARMGTPAATFNGQVPPPVLRQRVERLSRLERALARRYYESLAGGELEVLVERASEDRAGWYRGTDRRYVPVELPGSEADVGQLVRATGREVFEHHLEASRESRLTVGERQLAGFLDLSPEGAASCSRGRKPTG
jgi:threonylcarbamoyladenosine tRNA methylthiotransferase MtaB